MTTRPYELLARFAPDGTVAGVSVRTITTMNGRDYEGDPQPLSGAEDPAFIGFADQFAAAAFAELTMTKSDRDDLQKELNEATEQITTLQSSIAELDATREQLATAQAALAEANLKIAELQNAMPWDVRIVDATSFLNRITQLELIDLLGSDDPIRRRIGEMLVAYKRNDWPIMLDSPEMQQAIDYLVKSSAITQQRAAQLLDDSTREESYRAGD